MNWMVDFYSISMLDKISDFQLLHCDTLRNTSESACYWRQMSQNMKNGVQKVVAQNDTFGMTSLLGFSLHSVQDFYSHSSWVETHPRNGSCDCFRTDTFFQYYYDNITGMPNIFSDACEMCERVERRINDTMVPHGDYCYGINKDSYVRPNHEEAFIYAFMASLEWINTTKSWADEIDPSFWPRVLSYNGVNPSADWSAGYLISSWLVTGANNDGHWKGSGSGSGVRGLVKYLEWSLRPTSKLVKKVKSSQIYKQLTSPSPYNFCSPYTIGNDSAVIPIDPDFTKDMRVVIVRTVEIYETDNTNLNALIQSNFTTNSTGPEFWLYAYITIGNQTFIESTQREVLRPFWTSMKVVKLSELNSADPTINISYSLMQENTWQDDTLLDINTRTMNATFAKAVPSPLNMVYHINSHMLTGDVNGVFDSYNNPALAVGSFSYIKFYVTTLDLSSCATDLYFGEIGEQIPSQCPNTAAAQNGAPFICSPKGIREANAEFRTSIAAITLPIGYFVLAIMLGSILWCVSRGRARKRRDRTQYSILRDT